MSSEDTSRIEEACDAHMELCGEIEKALWQVLRSGRAGEEACEKKLVHAGVLSAGILVALKSLRENGPDDTLLVLQEQFLELCVMVEENIDLSAFEQPTKH